MQKEIRNSLKRNEEEGIFKSCHSIYEEALALIIVKHLLIIFYVFF